MSKVNNYIYQTLMKQFLTTEFILFQQNCIRFKMTIGSKANLNQFLLYRYTKLSNFHKTSKKQLSDIDQKIIKTLTCFIPRKQELN